MSAMNGGQNENNTCTDIHITPDGIVCCCLDRVHAVRGRIRGDEWLTRSTKSAYVVISERKYADSQRTNVCLEDTYLFAKHVAWNPHA